MKKYIFLAFGLLIALNLGCVLVTVEYPTIADNNGVDGPNPAVNTNGKAHLNESSQTIDFLPNGDNAELVAFIDQDAKGLQRQTAYQIESTGSPSSHFHSDTYCNPDWNGCAFMSEQYVYDPTFANCSWAGLSTRFNFNCVGIGFTGICTTYRSGECGRYMAQIPASTMINIANQAIQTRLANGREAYKLNINGSTGSLTMSAGASSLDFKIRGNIPVTVIPGEKRVLVDATSPSNKTNLQSYANKLRSLHSSSVSLRVCYGSDCKTVTTPGKGQFISNIEKSAIANY